MKRKSPPPPRERFPGRGGLGFARIGAGTSWVTSARNAQSRRIRTNLESHCSGYRWRSTLQHSGTTQHKRLFCTELTWLPQSGNRAFTRGREPRREGSQPRWRTGRDCPKSARKARKIGLSKSCACASLYQRAAFMARITLRQVSRALSGDSPLRCYASHLDR